MTLPYVAVLPDGYTEGRPYPLVIGLHGFGAGKDDLTGLAGLLGPGYVCVFPDAPLQAFDGADPSQRAWYERGGNETPAAVRVALAALDGFVQAMRSRYHTPSGRALLLGFSQGGAMALRYGLPRPDVFAGVVALSGSLRRPEELTPTLPREKGQPIFIAHGRADQVVPAQWAIDVTAYLQRQGYRPASKIYPAMGHFIGPALANDLRTWVRTVLPPAPND